MHLEILSRKRKDGKYKIKLSFDNDKTFTKLYTRERIQEVLENPALKTTFGIGLL
tara:strand:- start:1428 stop:1592 length:165 start_codon:yes stop_codon:yes gene_type:complete